MTDQAATDQAATDQAATDQAPDHSDETGRADDTAAADFFDPDRYRWPPDPVEVQLFVLAMLALGGPLTWWAVTR
jgi:hypothetical protein